MEGHRPEPGRHSASEHDHEDGYDQERDTGQEQVPGKEPHYERNDSRRQKEDDAADHQDNYRQTDDNENDKS